MVTSLPYPRRLTPTLRGRVDSGHTVWLNRFRRTLVRWEKQAGNYLATLHLACATVAYRAAGLLGWVLMGDDTWPTLPEALRADILAIVRVASG